MKKNLFCFIFFSFSLCAIFGFIELASIPNIYLKENSIQFERKLFWPISQHNQNIKKSNYLLSQISRNYSNPNINDVENNQFYVEETGRLISQQIIFEPTNSLFPLQMAFISRYGKNISEKSISELQTYLEQSFALSPMPNHKILEQRLIFCLSNWEYLDSSLKHKTRQSLTWYTNDWRWSRFNKELKKMQFKGQVRILLNSVNRKRKRKR